MIEKLKEINLLSFVCVKDIRRIKGDFRFEPDFIAIEPPELIGTKKSISSEKPSLIKNAMSI